MCVIGGILLAPSTPGPHWIVTFKNSTCAMNVAP
jgi:hypothetical protein